METTKPPNLPRCSSPTPSMIHHFQVEHLLPTSHCLYRGVRAFLGHVPELRHVRTASRIVLSKCSWVHVVFLGVRVRVIMKFRIERFGLSGREGV